MVLQNGMWKYNESGRLMPPMLRLPSQMLGCVGVECLDEAVGGRVGRVARAVYIEAANDLWIEDEVFSCKIH